MSKTVEEDDHRNKLLALIKKEVKHVMEEAVTRKFVHEESSSVSSLCSAVDACLSHGLKRRALGLFKTNSTTTALLQKVAKNYEPASLLYVKVSRMETTSETNSESYTQSPKQVPHHPGRHLRFTWIRVALFDKTLMGIVEHIVANSDKYYDKEGLLADAVLGEIFASLLIGPCSLDYSKMKTQDHFWTDPSADELLQRHRMSSSVMNGHSIPPSGRKPLGVTYKWSTSSLDFGSKTSSGSDDSTPRGSLACSPREFVDSLHQNCRSTLLYGKNNVVVQAEGRESVAGYLSLHSTSSSLVIKWTPNHIMKTESNESTPEKRIPSWDLAMNVSLEDVVYLHCHVNDEGGTMVLVGQDGVQRPPMNFPRGGHLLAFLTCLESGLAPFGQIDPPLETDPLEGKIFPRLKLKRSFQTITEEEDQGSDYIFRILADFNRTESLVDDVIAVPKSSPSRWTQWLKRHATDVVTPVSNSTATNKSDDSCSTPTTDKSIQSMCNSMKKQIICRAFYGWLTHTKHIRTVRTHLTRLVNPDNKLSHEEEQEYSQGLTRQVWESFMDDKKAVMSNFKQKLYYLLYYGGCEHSLRKEVWPYLLGHHDLGMNLEERRTRDMEVKKHYEETMIEWKAVAEVVKQRDKEITAANLAKLSSESTTSSSDLPPETTQRQISNEVFSESRDDNKIKKENGHRKRGKISRQFELQSKGSQSGQDSCEQQATDDEHEQNGSCPAISSNEFPCSSEVLDLFSLNLHRIEKDVQRCDRNYYFYAEKENLDKLRNVMCTYVWENLDHGYVQGMCDLVAPLLVIFDDEVMTYSCFIDLMTRMSANFPNGNAMDAHFNNLRSLIQVLDYEVFELMHANGDYTHFYFCYRWFLLDFKRELAYDDVFLVWEVIWSAKYVSSCSFVLFIAAALVQTYRDVIISNNMDFTDIIKFFNEMAERHDTKAILETSRRLVKEIQSLVQDL